MLEEQALCGGDVKVVDQLSVICQLNSVVFLLEYFQKYLYLNRHVASRIFLGGQEQYLGGQIFFHLLM